MQILRFQRGDEVRKIGSNTRLTVKAIVNDPERGPIMKGDKETGPDNKVYSCTSNMNRDRLFKDEELELWTENED